MRLSRQLNLAFRHRKLQIAGFLLLTFLAQTILIFAGGAVNYYGKGDQYSRAFAKYDGFFIASPTSLERPNTTGEEADSLFNLRNESGVLQLIYSAYPDIDINRQTIDRLSPAKLRLFEPFLAEIVDFGFSPQLAEIAEPSEGEVQIIVSDTLSIKPGDRFPLTTKDGQKREALVVATLPYQSPYLSFNSWGSNMSFTSLLEQEPLVLFWRDDHGLCIEQDKVYGNVSSDFGALLILDEEISSVQRQALLEKTQTRSYLLSSFDTLQENTKLNRQEYSKKTLLLPLFMVLISTIYLITSALLHEERYVYRFSVYRLLGLSKWKRLWLSVLPVIAVNTLSFIYFVIMAMLLTQTFNIYLENAEILIDRTLYLSSFLYSLILILIVSIITAVLTKSENLSTTIRRSI